VTDDFNGDPREPRQLTAAEWIEKFNQRSLDVKHAADEWAVRWNEPEGKFISALLGATGMLGQLLASGQERMEAIAAESRAAAEQEITLLRSAIQGAEHVMRQGEFAVRQARQVQAGVVVEREHMATRMIKETLPLFADKLQNLLVIKEQAWNERQSLKRYLSAGYILLGVFLAGFFLRYWQDYTEISAIDRCVSHPVQAGGQVYCNVSSLSAAQNTSGE
jgi:hypothetical protein